MKNPEITINNAINCNFETTWEVAANIKYLSM
jgi:hypothetical protein